MTPFNSVLWIVSVVAQCVLLLAMFTRKIARSVPLFTSLIAFYVVRSIALLALAAQLRGPAGALILSGLAMVDVLLQTAVAWELFTAGRHPLGAVHGVQLRRLAALSILLFAALAAAALISHLTRVSPQMPLDRGILFNSALFLLVFFACSAQRAPSPSRRIAAGFASFAASSLLCQIELARSVVQRDITAYHFWSYVQPVSYVAVVLFWILVLPKKTEQRIDFQEQ
jgi:hypothetical protein